MLDKLRTLFRGRKHGVVQPDSDHLSSVDFAKFVLPPNDSPPPTPSEQRQTDGIVASTVEFGFRLFGRVAKSSPRSNLIVSPLSLTTALAITACASYGETRRGIARCLCLGGNTERALETGYPEIGGKISAPRENMDVRLANGLWVHPCAAISGEFRSAANRYPRTEVASLDFASPQALDTINSWVFRHTQGKIESIVSSLSATTRMVIANAIYFYGKWRDPFEMKNTRLLPFYSPSGAHPRPMMHNAECFWRYFETRHFQAVALPYKTESATMFVFLPKSGHTLEAFISELNADDWNRWMKAFENRAGEVILPRFEFQWGADLSSILQDLGMEAAFDPGRAEFPAIESAGEPIFISQCLHKSMVSVDEAGTEAAAVSVLKFSGCALPDPTRPFRLLVDRPFFFAIRDGLTETLLFAGCVYDPAA